MKDEILYIWLQQAVGIYSRLPSEIFPRFKSISEIYECNDFYFLGEKRERYISRLGSKDLSHAFEVMKRCQMIGVTVTGYYDELYPSSLRKIQNPPVALYSIGKFKNLNDLPCIAIVGTRKMTDYGRETAENFAYNFSKSGAVVVSGLAKGVDTAAHRGAVMADGYTIGVLGNPIGDIYPKENKKAFETLYQCGLVVSELYPGAPRTRADFPNRNRIISGISDAVVIAEAGEGSGALITAKHALDQGKSIYAVPGTIGAENAGTNQLIKQGIPIATDPYDVLSSLSLEYPEKIHVYEPSVTANLRSYGTVISRAKDKETQKQIILEAEQTEPISEKESLSGDMSERIRELLKGSNPLTADEIALDLGIDVSSVMTELTLMEIDGSVTVSAGGRYTYR